MNLKKRPGSPKIGSYHYVWCMFSWRQAFPFNISNWHGNNAISLSSSQGALTQLYLAGNRITNRGGQANLRCSWRILIYMSLDRRLWVKILAETNIFGQFMLVVIVEYCCDLLVRGNDIWGFWRPSRSLGRWSTLTCPFRVFLMIASKTLGQGPPFWKHLTWSVLEKVEENTPSFWDNDNSKQRRRHQQQQKPWQKQQQRWWQGQGQQQHKVYCLGREIPSKFPPTTGRHCLQMRRRRRGGMTGFKEFQDVSGCIRMSQDFLMLVGTTFECLLVPLLDY